MYFTNNSFGKTLFFFQFLVSNILHRFPTFYANIPKSWKINFSHIFHTSSFYRIPISMVWNYITIDNNSAHFREFPSHNIINFINQLFTSEWEFKDWNHIKR